jgi:hypothetical protein
VNLLNDVLAMIIGGGCKLKRLGSKNRKSFEFNSPPREIGGAALPKERFPKYRWLLSLYALTKGRGRVSTLRGAPG